MGKSGLAKLVALQIRAEHVEFDKFAFRPATPTPYPGCLTQPQLDAAISAAFASGKPVALDAVCLEEVAPISNWGRGFVIYVKRLSFNSPNPLWHRGFDIDDDVPEDEPRRSIVLYHNRYKPHERADLIVELPEEGHTISSLAFDRRLCFDPLGAEIIRT